MAGEAESSARPAAQPSRARRFLSKAAALAASLLVSGGIAEGAFRIAEWREQKASFQRGEGGIWQRDPRWCWRMKTGWWEVKNTEFHAKGVINDLGMNDLPVDAAAERDKTRILALGDSHTYAVGVSMSEAWPRVLEGDLAAAKPGKGFRVYNTGTPGYSLHQYLLRLIDQGPLLKPDYVVVGFSYATDLYDLLPQDHGGWVYGWPDQPRDYFDLDEGGRLVERRHVPDAKQAAGPVAPENKALRLRTILGSLAMLRYFQRSNLGFAVGSRLSAGGQSLWANVEIVVEKETTPRHEYQWRLARALLERMRDEAARQGAKLVVVGIPYLPQVYDDVWKVTFAGNPRFSRTAAIEKMAALCAELGVPHVDTTEALRKKSAELGHRVHHPKDAHPTIEGQAVIAETIASAGVIAPVR